MQNLYLTVGLPGSGKSTWAKEFVKKNPNTIIVSKDDIRTMINGGKYFYDSKKEDIVKLISIQSLTYGISYGYNVIMDGTYLTEKRRFKIIDIAENFVDNFLAKEPVNITICYFTERENNLKYRMKESRGVSEEQWDTVINSMKQSIEIPRFGEHDFIDAIIQNPEV